MMNDYIGFESQWRPVSYENNMPKRMKIHTRSICKKFLHVLETGEFQNI